MFNQHSAVLWGGKCPAEHATAASIAATDHLNVIYLCVQKHFHSFWKRFLNDSFRTSDTPELMIFSFPLSCLLPCINVPRPVITQPRWLLAQLASAEAAVHVNKS